jgi:8-oxo-dGTP diphosphatase
VLTILRDNKKSIPNPDMWDFPGGGREGNENPAEVAIREINEELNLTLTPEEFIWKKYYPSVDDASRTACFLVANLTDKELEPIKLGDEGQQWKFMTFDEFLNHPKAIEGMKTRLRDYLAENSDNN